jgi:hypothetical protein
MYTRNDLGPRRDPWSIPDNTRIWREYFTECDGMLAVHVLCGWNSRTPRLLTDRPLSVPEFLQSWSHLQCFRTPYISRTAVVSLSHSSCARVSTTGCTCKAYILCTGFVTVGRRPHVYSKSLIQGRIALQRTGTTNIHNKHGWSDKNPHANRSHHHYWQFSINYVGWDFRWLPHMPSQFTRMS